MWLASPQNDPHHTRPFQNLLERHTTSLRKDDVISPPRPNSTGAIMFVLLLPRHNSLGILRLIASDPGHSRNLGFRAYLCIRTPASQAPRRTSGPGMRTSGLRTTHFSHFLIKTRWLPPNVILRLDSCVPFQPQYLRIFVWTTSAKKTLT